MNAVVDSTVSAPRASQPISWAQRMRWLLKREFWEHKGGFFWAPLVAGAVSLLLSLLGGGTGQVMLKRHGSNFVYFDGREVSSSDFSLAELLSTASASDLRQMYEALNWMTLMSSAWPLVVFGFVVFFYFLGSLYDERKDRSVLFWKSLPLSDRDTVLSKLVTGLIVAPLIATALAIATMLGFGVILSLFILINGANPITLYWAQLDPGMLLGAMLGWIPVYALWAVPTAGWLMLCSAWARSKPFLWAIAVPVLSGLLVTWFDLMGAFEQSSGWFWENIVVRGLVSAWPGSHLLGYIGTEQLEHLEDTPAALLGLDGVLVGGHLFTTPSLWIGIAVGAAMIFAAIRLRRWRDEG